MSQVLFCFLCFYFQFQCYYLSQTSFPGQSTPCIYMEGSISSVFPTSQLRKVSPWELKSWPRSTLEAAMQTHSEGHIPGPCPHGHPGETGLSSMSFCWCHRVRKPCESVPCSSVKHEQVFTAKCSDQGYPGKSNFWNEGSGVGLWVCEGKRGGRVAEEGQSKRNEWHWLEVRNM